MSEQSAPAGWYQDPHGTGQRYWDGIQWTEHTTPGVQAAGVVQPSDPVTTRDSISDEVSADRATQSPEAVVATGASSPSGPSSPTADSPASRRRFGLAWVIAAGVMGVVVGFVLASLGQSATQDTPTAASPEPSAVTVTSTPGDGAESPEPTESSAAPSTPTQQLTVSQQQALESAKSYLAMGSGFSRAGLIEQLSSKAGEGFPKADAVWAVDHLDVDWNQQAVLSAKNYLEMGGFSRASLIEQLSSSAGEGFTRAQAEYAANKVGL